MFFQLGYEFMVLIAVWTSGRSTFLNRKRGTFEAEKIGGDVTLVAGLGLLPTVHL
jgi:hypothetical protein